MKRSELCWAWQKAVPFEVFEDPETSCMEILTWSPYAQGILARDFGLPATKIIAALALSTTMAVDTILALAPLGTEAVDTTLPLAP